MTTYEKLLTIQQTRGAGFIVLLDPDRNSLEEMILFAQTCEAEGVDALLIGSSILFSSKFDNIVGSIKQAVKIPIILFPGSGRQLSGSADALLFMSVISGRNPHYLIGEQVLAAPVVRSLGLEPISTGYILVESGNTTSAEFFSGSRSLPREKPEIAVAHALAAEYLGIKLVYLEGGSGAKLSVPTEMIYAVKSNVSIPLIVGGGIRTPDDAAEKVHAGASFIVIGNILEDEKNKSLIKLFAKAIHYKELSQGSN